jgi:hypothetical protein
MSRSISQIFLAEKLKVQEKELMPETSAMPVPSCLTPKALKILKFYSIPLFSIPKQTNEFLLATLTTFISVDHIDLKISPTS